MLSRLALATAGVVDADGAAIVLVRQGGDTEVLANAGDGAGPLAERQFQLGIGPVLDAHSRGETTSTPDLADVRDARWPSLAAQVEEDAGAVLAIPLRVGAVRLGVLAVHRHLPGSWSAEDELDAAAFADLMASALLDHLAGVESPDLTSLPQHAVVHQATGMLAAQLDIDLAEALARLRAHAYADDRPLYDVSVDVVTRALRLDP